MEEKNKGRSKQSEYCIKDFLLESIFGEMLITGLCILCYGEWIWMLPLQVVLIPYFSYMRKHRKAVLEKKYRQGFLNLLQSLMTSLQTGYSLENACRRAYQEMKKLYMPQGHPILDPLQEVIVGLELQIPPERLFHIFAQTTGIQDIHQFAVILEIAVSTGGNIVTIMRNTIEHMNIKMESEEEIRTALSGKIYEKNIMLGMPFFILLYLRIANPGYLDVFYRTFAGHMLMTLFIAAVVLCFFWAEKILYGCMNR